MQTLFEKQVLPLIDSAYRYAMALTRSVADAEDLVQEATLRAYGSFTSLRGDDAKPWLLTIVRNTHLTLQRRRRTAISLSELDETTDSVFVDSQPGPEELACDTELQHLLGSLVAQLKPEQREVLLLREVEDLNYREIANVLGIAEGTVMSRLARARAALKTLRDARRMEI